MRLAGDSTLQALGRQHSKGLSEGQFAGMPRSIRARLLNPRKKVSVKAPAAATAASATEQQGVATNPLGRMALGPWLGPFSGILDEPEAPTSPTMYVHYKGRVFSDLDGSPVATVEVGLEQLASPRGGAVAASALPVTPRQRRDHSKELALVASKGAGKRHNEVGYGNPRFGASLRRTRMLNQPRSNF